MGARSRIYGNQKSSKGLVYFLRGPQIGLGGFGHEIWKGQSRPVCIRSEN